MPANKERPAVSHEGHRQRMKERYLTSGLEGFSAHEIVEMLLFYAVPYRDTNPLGHQLIDQFGGFTNLLEATYADLVKQPGVTPHIATLICLVRDIARRYHMESASETVTQLHTVADAAQHIKPWFLGQRAESVVLMSLDNKLKVLNITRVTQGTVNNTSFEPRLIVEQVIQDNATAVVLAHNHPNGYAFPSVEDIVVTQHLCELLRALSVDVLDHLVVSENDCTSMAQSYYVTGRFIEDIRRVIPEQLGL